METATGARARGGEESESGGGGRRLEMDGGTGTRDFRGEVRGERVTWRIVMRRIANGRGSAHHKGVLLLFCFASLKVNHGRITFASLHCSYLIFR
jgi:hypothetical protein